MPAPTNALGARRILIAGVTVGLLDALFLWVTYVLIRHVTTLERIFQSVAAGLLGKAAFAGGWSATLLGVACHFGVGLAWATAYFLVYRRWARLRHLTRSRVGAAVAGIILGVVIWTAMDIVVIPLTGARQTTVGSGTFWFFMLQHAVMLGPAIVFIER